MLSEAICNSSVRLRADMPIATKNNALILSNNRLAESCSCCGLCPGCPSLKQTATLQFNGYTVAGQDNYPPVGLPVPTGSPCFGQTYVAPYEPIQGKPTLEEFLDSFFKATHTLTLSSVIPTYSNFPSVEYYTARYSKNFTGQCSGFNDILYVDVRVCGPSFLLSSVRGTVFYRPGGWGTEGNICVNGRWVWVDQSCSVVFSSLGDRTGQSPYSFSSPMSACNGVAPSVASFTGARFLGSMSGGASNIYGTVTL